MYGLLIAFHIAAGTIALVAAAVALATSKRDRWHVYAGRAFTLGMVVGYRLLHVRQSSTTQPSKARHAPTRVKSLGCVTPRLA